MSNFSSVSSLEDAECLKKRLNFVFKYSVICYMAHTFHLNYTESTTDKKDTTNDNMRRYPYNN